MAVQRRLRVLDCGAERDGGNVDTTLRVAFATTDMKHVNQHFGSAQNFAVYLIDSESFDMLEATEFGKLDQNGNEDKLADKIAMLQGCAVVYCQAVGPVAVKQLMAMGVHPFKVNEGSSIPLLIGELQEEMRSGPPKWLARVIRRQQGQDMNRFDAMETEGWDE